MTMQSSSPVHLIARWTIQPGREQEAIAALTQFASEVLAHEPGTLVYNVHTPAADAPPSLVSRPSSSPASVVFYEIYQSAEAYQAHLDSPRMARFIQEHGGLFLQMPAPPGACPAQPFILVEFLEQRAGFTRDVTRTNGVALYRFQPGRLEGQWTADVPGFEGRTGLELAEKQEGAPGELPGRYHVRIWNPGENPPQPPLFEGTLVITALPGGTAPELESYRLDWTKPSSAEAYTGLGLHRAGSDQLTVSYWNVPAHTPAAEPVNRHPAVMFEILARQQAPLLEFYQSLFGWKYQFGTGNFAYVSFPARPVPLLGGIGQANPAEPGFEAGRNFYLLVDDLRATLDKAQALGGSTYVEPAIVDGYHFAMMKDPEGNVIGLIQPFAPGKVTSG